MMKTLWRIFDANINRTREGLRVCEDVVRFSRNDRQLAAQLKACRHQLSQLLIMHPAIEKYCLEARNIRRDVGKKGIIRHGKKSGPGGLFAANFKRTEESLRVLEECSKLIAPELTERLQALRFRIYELEKKMFGRVSIICRHKYSGRRQRHHSKN